MSMKYASFVANWVLGILFFIISLLAIINSSFVSGLFLLIASLTLMPISRRFVLPKINEKMSPMIRAAFVSMLFIGFVLSVQPNEAQILEKKELRLAAEAALLEQQQTAKAAGFLSVEEYEAEKKRLTAEAEKKQKAEEAEQKRLIAEAEEKRKAEEAENARHAEIENVLICQSRTHSVDYEVIALYSKTADIIAFSSSGIFESGTIFDARITKSRLAIDIRNYKYHIYQISRQNLTLFKSYKIGTAIINNMNDCRVASVTDYKQARNVLKKHADAMNKKWEKARQEEIKNQKI